MIDRLLVAAAIIIVMCVVSWLLRRWERNDWYRRNPRD